MCFQADICMNSKTEFHQPSIVRVTANLGNPNDEQTGPQGTGRGRGGGGGRGRGARGGGGGAARHGQRQPGV